VTTSTRLGLIEDIVISIVVFLVVSLRNTDGTVFQGANSDRARMRLFMFNFKNELLKYLDVLESRVGANELISLEDARQYISDRLIQLAPVFKSNKYLFDEYSLLDITLAPLLWRLNFHKIKLPREARSGSAKLNMLDKCIIGAFSHGIGAVTGGHHEQIIWAANPPRIQFGVQGQGGFGRVA